MEIKQTVYNRVFAIGTLTDYNKAVELKEMNGANEWSGLTFELGLNAVNGTNKNMQGVKFFGGLVKDNVKNGFPIEWENGKVVKSVAYDKRHDVDTLQDVPQMKKKTYSNGDVKREFLCDKEFVAFLHSEVKNLVGKRVFVSGEMEHSLSKGKVYKKIIVSRIDVLSDEDNREDKVEGNLQLFFDSNVIDQSIFSGNSVKFDMVQELAGEENKIVLPVYMVTNNSDKSTKKDVPKLFIPTEVVINTEKIDWASPVHKKMVAFLLKSFKCADAETVYTIGYSLRYFAGFNNKEYSEEEILALFTEDEIEALEMGEMMSPGYKDRAIKNKSGDVKGDKINETRLVCPHETTLVTQEALGITSAHLDLYKSIMKDKDDNKTSSAKKEEKTVEPKNNITDPTDFGAVFG